MEKQIFFSERQKFNQWWIWLILIGINSTFIVAICIQLFADIPFGNNPMVDVPLVISFVATLALSILFLTLCLETQISAEGIYVRFLPFHLKAKFFPWNDIKTSIVRKYSPIGEYGGWGLRGFKSNMAYNVSGNMGLQLEFISGKKLLIGTQKQDEIKKALQSLDKLNVI
jgi:hypothetical protein